MQSRVFGKELAFSRNNEHNTSKHLSVCDRVLSPITPLGPEIGSYKGRTHPMAMFVKPRAKDPPNMYGEPISRMLLLNQM